MAKFDVYRRTNGPGYLLDLQANILSGLNTRFVAPLLPPSHAPIPAARLNPMFDVMGERCVMVTQFVGAVPVNELGPCVGSLMSEDTAVTGALDMLTGGY
ncbi:CcdB family protein [Azospirillum sp. sgz302134]